MHKLAVDVIFTQITVNKDINNHGEIVLAEMYKEYKQQEDMKLMGELDPDSLTIPQKKGSLRVINLIKQKWSGKLKGGTREYGRPQRCYITK